MELTRCERGHYYDKDKYGTCPECDKANDVPTMREVEEANYVCPPTKPEIENPNDPITKPHFKVKNCNTAPVVGWLVCVEGTQKGQDFRLKTGGNYIGRSTSSDVCIEKDLAVSREKHLIVTFEPKQKQFWVTPGDTRELSYLNGDVVLERKELKAYDTISVGNTSLTFVPFCTDKFSWEEDK